MNIWTILLISLGLAMDAIAVSMACGVVSKRDRFFNGLKFGFSFGFFQMLMPILGWILGTKLSSLVQAFDHWIAFGLLSFIGGKMIYESFQMEKMEKSEDGFGFRVMLVLSIATSIDALAVGMSFAFLKVAILFPALMIGIITFFLSFCGFLIGHKYGHWFEGKIEIAGGIILIGIGLKILIQHLMFF